MTSTIPQANAQSITTPINNEELTTNEHQISRSVGVGKNDFGNFKKRSTLVDSSSSGSSGTDTLEELDNNVGSTSSVSNPATSSYNSALRSDNNRIKKFNNALEFMNRFDNEDFVSVCFPPESPKDWGLTWPAKFQLQSDIRLIELQREHYKETYANIEANHERNTQTLKDSFERNSMSQESYQQSLKSIQKERKEGLIRAWEIYQKRPKIVIQVNWRILRDKGKYVEVKSNSDTEHELTYAQIKTLSESIDYSIETYHEYLALKNNNDLDQEEKLKQLADVEPPKLDIINLVPKVIYAKDYSETAQEATDLTDRVKQQLTLERRFVGNSTETDAFNQAYRKSFWWIHINRNAKKNLELENLQDSENSGENTDISRENSQSLADDINSEVQDSEENPIWSDLPSLCIQQPEIGNKVLKNDPNIIDFTALSEIVIVSDRTAPDMFNSLWGQYSLMALYVSVVFFTGKLLRSAMNWSADTVMFTELPNVDRVWELFNDLHLVREMDTMAEKERFTLEEDLVAQITFLFRSPEALIKYTRHPKKKQKKIRKGEDSDVARKEKNE